jgi:chitodextrinase
MTRAPISRIAAAAGIVVLAGACTLSDQDPPPLTGPSELAQSIVIAVSPDVLPQDGASQSFITVTARDANAQPIRNLTMRTETQVNGTPVDFGTLSARNVVTGSDGRATLVYTAPPSPAVAPDAFLLVDIVVTPFGSDFNNSSQRTASIRLVPQGTVIPPGDLVPAFTMTPTTPVDGQTVLFDASTSTGSIAEYRWSFGDGGQSSGRAVSHAFSLPGTYVVTLTLVDPYGRTQSKSQSITVSAGGQPTAAFVFSPTNPRVGQSVNFNASGSRPPAGSSIASYTWDFGDGSPRVTTASPVVSKTYGTAATYTVTLLVTDSSGRTATVSVTMQIAP